MLLPMKALLVCCDTSRCYLCGKVHKKILDKGMEKTLEPFMISSAITEIALRHITWITFGHFRKSVTPLKKGF